MRLRHKFLNNFDAHLHVKSELESEIHLTRDVMVKRLQIPNFCS